MLLSILAFWVLVKLSAPFWCYIIATLSMLVSMFRFAFNVGRALHILNKGEDEE